MELLGNWSYPTQILFGNGRVKELSSLLKSHGLKRPLFVTDKGLMNQKITKDTLNDIVSQGFEYLLFSNVDPNPNELNLPTFKRVKHIDRFQTSGSCYICCVPKTANKIVMLLILNVHMSG